MARRISMGARREVVWAVAERYRAAGRHEKGRILDELTATTGWHRKHAVRALSAVAASRTGRLQPGEETPRTVDGAAQPPTGRRRKYAGARDALIALWEASDRVCGKRLVAMIPALLPALERHGRLQPTSEERGLLLLVSAATIDRMLVDVKIAAAGGRRRRVGFYSAIRREVPIRTFNDWGNPPPGFCEIDMVAHGGTSVAGSFIQTLTMVDIATGWTECLPLVARDGSLVVEAMTRRTRDRRLPTARSVHREHLRTCAADRSVAVPRRRPSGASPHPVAVGLSGSPQRPTTPVLRACDATPSSPSARPGCAPSRAVPPPGSAPPPPTPPRAAHPC